MGTIEKIKFNYNCNISRAYSIFLSLLNAVQYDFSKVTLSFYFYKLELIDKILYEAGIEHIEGFTWEETSDVEKITDQKYLKNLLSLYISTDKFNISASSIDMSLLPEEFSVKKQDFTNIYINKKMKRNYSFQEENEAKMQLTALCKEVFNDISTLRFTCSRGESMDFVTVILTFPFLFISQNLSCLLRAISTTFLRAAYCISINKYTKNNISQEFIRKFETRPDYIYLPGGGWHAAEIYKMPFAVNSLGTMYPVCNCNIDSAFKLAEFAQNNITLFNGFRFFVSNISWPCKDHISVQNPMNNIIFSLSKKEIKIELNYSRYKDSDPTTKSVRDFISKCVPILKGKNI